MANDISTLEKLALGIIAATAAGIAVNAAYAIGYYVDKHYGGNGITGGSIAQMGFAGLVGANCYRLIKNKPLEKGAK